MTRPLALFFTIIMIFSASLGIAFTHPYEVFSDISYGKEEANTMDIYVPYTAYTRKSNGCILYIHGGSWIEGDKAAMKKHCIRLAKEGYITVTMNYTLLDLSDVEKYSMSKVMNEVTAAIKEIKSFSDKNGLHIEKLATSGFSAGAQISMLYSYKMPEKSVIPIKFTADMSGPTYFNDDYWRSGIEIYAYILHGDYPADIDDYSAAQTKQYLKKCAKELSPVTYVKKTIVPSLFAYGEKDKTVSYKQATYLKGKLDSVGATYEMISFPHSGHSLDNDPSCTTQYNKKLLEYCKTYFGY